MTEKMIQSGIISDVDVLIDYAQSAPNILKLISKHVRKLHVADQVLREVAQLDEAGSSKLGIEVIEPTLAQIIEANEVRQNKPTLSGPDAICFVMARDNDWACLTNDKSLRRFCLDNKVNCIWGIEIMLHLVSLEKLHAEKAYRIACDIQAKNKHIKSETIDDFRNKLGL
jgi:rRNA-processing protein FCF1